MIFALLAILCLHALGVHASLTCNKDQPSVGPSDAKLNGLFNTVKGSVAQLCHTRQVGTLSHVHEDTVFTVERGTTLYGDDCVQSFSTIVTQCKVGGGVITDADKGIKYMVSVKEKTSKRDEGGLEARAKKGNKPSKPKSTEEAETKASEETKPKSTEETKPKTTEESKPKSSEGTKPTPTEKSKSTEDIKSKSTKDSTPPPTAATAKPTSKAPTSKPAPKPTTPSVSQSKSVSPTPSKKSPSPTPTPTPSRDCKKIYNKLVAESNKYELNERSLSGLVSRDGYSGSRVHIEKRYRTKKGTACGTYLLYAHEYPSPNEMRTAARKPQSSVKNPLYYGYSQPTICNNYVFRAASGPVSGIPQGDYHLEHVLEWQVVTQFFEWIKLRKKPGQVFPSPDRTQPNTMVDFCTYWRETWNHTRGMTDMPKFDLPGEDNYPRLPFEHLQDAYPGRRSAPPGQKKTNAYFEDFVYLHKTINSPAKSNMWDSKLGMANPGVFGRDDMATRCTGRTIQLGEEALQWLRALMGARKYMANKQIAGILKRQKLRIGKVLTALDAEMAHHPKPGFNAWQPQGLGALWDEYMDWHFDEAVRRTNADMREYLGMVKATWTSLRNQNMLGEIKKLENEWNMEKKRPWSRPW